MGRVCTLFGLRCWLLRDTLGVAGSIPEHVIEEILRRTDVVRLVGNYCDLKKKGRSHWACCPFHQEKTPSFKVDADSGLYYCFGCKEGGTVFSFLQQMEGLTFPEAVERLAEQAGIELKRDHAAASAERGRMSRLRNVNELATTYYEKCLQKARGSEIPRNYMAERHITTESIERWRIGFAPDGWENLLKCAHSNRIAPETLVDAGLASPRRSGDGHVDRFHNRLMFPITDAGGRTIAFGARTLDGEEPKYLNTAETPLFVKSQCFFGLAQARAAIRSGETAVILEGYTDVIMAHQAGVDNTIAVLGTALTEHHARVLSRLGCKRVIVVFDGDESGQRSAARSVDVLLAEDFEIRVARLPAGQDPCDFVDQNGGEAFRTVLDESMSFFEFRLERARGMFDTSTLEGRGSAFDEMMEMTHAIHDPARRDMVVRWIATQLGVSETQVWGNLGEHQKQQRRRRRPQQTIEPRKIQTGTTPELRCAADLAGMALTYPEIVAALFEQLDTAQLPDSLESRLLQALAHAHAEGRLSSVQAFLTTLDEPEMVSVAARAIAQEAAGRTEPTPENLRERVDQNLAFLARASQTTPIDNISAEPTPDELHEVWKHLDARNADTLKRWNKN
jgi:DNA primase